MGTQPKTELPAWETEEEESIKQDISISESSESIEESDLRTPDWLKNLIEADSIPLKETEVEQEETTKKIPTWMQESDIEETQKTAESDFQEEIDKEELESVISEIDLSEGVDSTTEESAAAEIETSPPVDMEDTEAALAWLENLAAKQGAAEEELETKSEQRVEEPPEWIKKFVEEENIEEVIETTETKESVHERSEPRAKMDTPQVEEGITEAENKINIDEELSRQEEAKTEESSEWIPEIKSIEGDIAEETIEEEISHATTEPQKEETSWENKFEPPTWVIKGEEPMEETTEWLPPSILEEVKTAAEREEKLDLNTASLIQLERLPGIGFRTAQSIVSYREAKGKFKSIDELRNVPEIDTTSFEILNTLTTIELPEQQEEEFEEEPKYDTRILPVIDTKKPQDKYQKLVADGQTFLSEGKIEAALEKFKSAIKHKKNIPNIIRLLENAAEANPKNINILQVLGDAYMREDRLQDALDTYTKAQNLLY